MSIATSAAADPLAARLAGSESEVLQIGAVTWIAGRLPQRIPDGVRRWAVAVLLSCLPAAVAGAATLAGKSGDGSVWVVIGCYGLLTLLAFRFAEASWSELISTCLSLGPVADRAALENLAERADQCLRRRNQVTAVLVGLLVGLVASVIVNVAKDTSPTFAAVWGLTLMWTGTIGGLTLYWITCVPIIFSGLKRISRPELDWISPQLTPGVDATDKLISAGATRASIGLFLFAIPVGLTMLTEPASLGVLVFAAVGLAISGFAVAIAVVLPRVWLSSLLRRGREVLLEDLRAQIPDLASLRSLRMDDMPASVFAYRQLLATAPPRIGPKGVVKMAAQGAFSILPYAAGPLLRTLGS